MDLVKVFELLKNDIPVFLVFVGFAVAIIRIVYKMIKDVTDKFEKKVDDILKHSEKIKIISDNFQKYQEVLNLMNADDTFFVIIDSEMNNLVALLSRNFANGSSIQNARNDILAFQGNLMSCLANRSDIANKEYYEVLIEFMYERLERLIDSLSNLTDFKDVKQKLIIPYISGLNACIDYFAIGIQKKFLLLTLNQVEHELTNKFMDFGTRLNRKRITTL